MQHTNDEQWIHVEPDCDAWILVPLLIEYR